MKLSLALLTFVLSSHMTLARNLGDGPSTHLLKCNSLIANVEYVLQFSPLTGISSVSEVVERNHGTKELQGRTYSVDAINNDETRLMVGLVGRAPFLVETPLLMIILKTQDFLDQSRFSIRLAQTTTGKWAKRETVFESGVCELKPLPLK